MLVVRDTLRMLALQTMLMLTMLMVMLQKLVLVETMLTDAHADAGSDVLTLVQTPTLMTPIPLILQIDGC